MTVGEINVTLQLFGSVLSLMIIFCLFIGGNAKTKTGRMYVLLLLLNMGGLLFDALAYMFRGKTYPFAYFGVRASNFLAFCSLCVFSTVFLSYLNEFVSVKRPGTCRPYLAVSWGVCVVYLVLYIVNLFVPIFYSIDANNIYMRSPLYGLTMVPAFLNMLLTVIILIKNKDVLTKSQITVFGMYVALPMIALPVQIFVYGLNFSSITTTLVVVIMLLFLQTEQTRLLLKEEKEVAEAKLALTESNNSLVLSQIQPHFLYNALTSIYRLCDVKPEAAKEAVSNFSKYLRGNLDSIKQTKMISFADELKHLQAYLSLEKIRFDNYLDIKYDIRTTEFFIPPLTVQPLVENAVNHGISDLPNGGCVTIATEEKSDHYEIRVSDNGVGFDPRTALADGRSHVGITNVRSRLNIMCHGTLDIKSAPGDGTVAIIQIPKGGATDEYHSS